MEKQHILFHPQSSSSSTMVSNTQLFGSFYGGGGTSGGVHGLKEEVDHHHKASLSTMQSHEASSSRMELLTENGSKDVDEEAKPSKKKGEKKVRKHRYAFQTRSQVDILDDGYRWRKYGQKAVKNNNFPRSYYRCTHQGCNVKKQVQRLSKDEGVVVTTYEGMHTHPIEKSNDNFEHILNQMQIYSTF